MDNYTSIKAATEAYFREDTSRISNKAFGYKDFNRWITFMESRVNQNGTLSDYSNALDQARQSILNRDNSAYLAGEWHSNGPVTNTNPIKASLGLITALWVDTTNFTTIYAGSNTGGLFVTNDRGENWSCLTDKYRVTGVESIVKNLRKPNDIYIGTGMWTWMKGYGTGIWKSTDNGLTWNETDLNSQSFDKSFIVPKILQNPTKPDTLLAVLNFGNKDSKIMKTYNGGDAWYIKYANTGNPQMELFDIDMNPHNPNIIIAGGRKLIFSNNLGESWIDITSRVIDTNVYKLNRIATSFHPVNSNKILVILEKQLNDSTFFRDLLLSVDGGNNFSSIAGSLDLSLLGYYKMEAEWSKSDLDIFYLGGYNVYKYKLLANNTVQQVTIPFGYHVDIRELETYKQKVTSPKLGTYTRGLIFQGNGGGVTLGIDSLNRVSWSDISRSGLNITQFYGLGIPADGSDYLVGGTQDGNFFKYHNGVWPDDIEIGDAGEAVYNFRNPDSVYLITFMTNYTARLSTDRGLTWPNNIQHKLTIGIEDRRNDSPIEMSTSNPKVLYLGGTNVWKTTNGKDFIKISNFAYTGKLKTIREAPSNSNVIYAAKENPTWNLTQNNNRLYKTINGGQTWIDITPNVPGINLQYAGIFDIAVDPNDPHTFYIALDRNWDGKKVYKGTGETGITWTNISQGLLNVPVNCLEIYKGSDLEELFAGTDDGIYYRNKNMTNWQPFGTGLPFTLVSDIEIDYINNEIIISTFGRGIYRANLCGISPLQGDITINGNEVWNGLKRIPGNITVKSGGKLTIFGTVKMNDNKGIIVEKGANLIVDGGIVSNQCRDLFWNGIRVLGNSTGQQNLLYQGLVVLKNGATIANAEIGIHCYNSTYEDAFPVNGGGIILASNSSFINNITAVQFEKYTYRRAISSFNLCNFLTDENFFQGSRPRNFVRLNEIGGIAFNGCTFKNSTTIVNNNFNNNGSGLYGNNAHFIVDQKCENNSIPCNLYRRTSFTGLRYGIYAMGKSGGMTFKINNAEFIKNDCGIYASGISNIEVKNTDFIIVKEGSSATGLYLDNSTGFIIEENEFKNIMASGNSDFSTGIIVNNSGASDNFLYKNSFSDIKNGIKAQNKNRNSNGSAGLVIKCNIFQNVKVDISILKTDPNATGMGIAGSQGANGTTCDTPAGNLFSNLAPSTGYYSIYNSGELVYYFHHNSSSHPNVRPSVVTEDSIIRMPTPWNYSISCCPPNSNGGGGTSIIGGEIASYKAESINTSGALSTLIDEGETTDKVLEVNLASPSEALEVRNSILHYSPFVSDTVLKSTINREELLNNAMLRDIMVANPHSAKSETLMQDLDMRLEPMPEYMKDEILEGIFVLSAKELMEAKRDMEMQFYNYGFNRILSASLTDTIPVPSDTLIALLNADGSALSLMLQAWILFEAGDTISALNRLETITNGITLNEQELSERTEQQIFMQWLSANPGIDSTDVEPLTNFVESSSLIVSSAARCILIANNLLEYNEPYLVLDLTKSTEISKPIPSTIWNQTQMIRVFPNPGKDYVIIEYNLGDNDPSGTYEVIDQSGKIVKRGNLGRRTDQVVLDTFDLTPGNYYISLSSASTSIASTRFVISKYHFSIQASREEKIVALLSF